MVKINLFIFSLSLFLGLFLVYVCAPRPEVIIKYPTMKNYNQLKYIDEGNRCYRYIPKNIKCPKN
tara:strand:+ start:888 stop:1082 length:195 start_codon:yes stop_codon:yes gene_type:complete